ncbi:hypothetical protein, partial [Enorma massiliensis]|uniref:hypothetical protein n=1 Tax=Enorma massiliensis TaxID=1472761 RepID=UPI003AF02845
PRAKEKGSLWNPSRKPSWARYFINDFILHPEPEDTVYGRTSGISDISPIKASGICLALEVQAYFSR